jgi:hypothetical protein
MNARKHFLGCILSYILKMKKEMRCKSNENTNSNFFKRSDILDYCDIILDLTMKYAKEVIGDDIDKLQVKFSNRMKYANGKCYPFKKLIVYNNRYLVLNKDNIEALKYTVIEECAHLRYPTHSKEFYELCMSLGYDVRTPPDGILFYWKYYKKCNKCGNGKYYYQEPRKLVCNNCGCSSIQLIKSDMV